MHPGWVGRAGAKGIPAMSTLTIGDLCREPDLKLRLLAGGAGARREIRGVHISDLPDPTKWTDPRDLLLTTGMALVRRIDLQRNLVRRLASHKTAGLGFGVGLFWHSVPQAILDEADQVGLPVLEVPYEVPFKSIVSYIMDFVMSSSAQQLHRRIAVQTHLLQVLLEEQGSERLAATLSSLLSVSTILFDGAGRVEAKFTKKMRLNDEDVRRIWDVYQPRLDAADELQRVIRMETFSVVFRDVRVGDRVERVLAVVYPPDEPVPEFTTVISSFAQKLLTLEVVKSRHEQETVARMRANMLSDLVSVLGSPKSLRARAAYFVDIGVEFVLVACDVSGLERKTSRSVLSEASMYGLKSEFADRVDSFFLLRKIPVLSMLSSDGVSALAQVGAIPREAVRAVAEEFRDWMDDGFPRRRFNVGVSQVRRGVGEVARAYAEAVEAVHAAKRESDRVVLFNELGPTSSILLALGGQKLRAVSEEGLGPLLQHDAAKNDHMVETLQAYIWADRDVQEASARLHVHPNTLRYRLRKIEEILGGSLESTRMIADLYLAFRAGSVLSTLGGSHQAEPEEPEEPEESSAAGESSHPDIGFGNLLVGRPAVVNPRDLLAQKHAR